jgi:hypothetical protein
MRPRAKEASSAVRGGVSCDAAGDLGLRGHVHVVLGKVDAGFEQRDQLNQRLLHGRDAPAERAAHLAGGLAGLGQRLRLDQVAHGLGLGEVEPAGKKGALGKLAGLGQPRAQIESAAQQQLQHHRRAVRGDLHQVLGGVGVGSGKECDQRLVDAGCVAAAAIVRRIEHIGQARPPVLQRLAQAHQLRGDGGGQRPAQAHDADAATARRRGDGGDGVGETMERFGDDP